MSDTQNLLRFGVFELNVTTEELRKSGTLIRLAPQPIKLLALLARRSGQVVTREEIQQALWGEETYVDFEQGMNHCIKQIRNALSDSADTPLYIETVPRRGYRFLAPVVTKKILAPPPRVVESQSGIQSNPVAGAPVVAVPAAKPVVTDPTAVLRAQPPSPSPATAPATEAAATELKPAPRGIPWKAIAIGALLLIALVAALLYWQSHKSAGLKLKQRAIVAVLSNSQSTSRVSGTSG